MAEMVPLGARLSETKLASKVLLKPWWDRSHVNMLRCEWKLTICLLIYVSLTEHLPCASYRAGLKDAKVNQTQS